MAMKDSITGAMDETEGDSPYRRQVPAMASRPVPGRTFLPCRNVHRGVARGTPGPEDARAHHEEQAGGQQWP